MLKLKYLFDNRDLAKMLLGYWEYDEDSLEMLNYYRISANAIYPFKCKGKTRLLRFAPVTEKENSNVLAELEFIRYLNSNGYPALRTVLSKDSEELVIAQTPWGEYFATTFDRVSGVQIGDTEYKDSIMFEFGKTLGRLHMLSSAYNPVNMYWSYEDVLKWVRNTLLEHKNQEFALEEVSLLQVYFSKLSKTSEIYGLVHYDFEMDNVFYDEKTDTCNVIDFDDAMYHWYAMDIEQSLDSIKQEIEPAKHEEAGKWFIKGYRSEYSVTDDILSLLPAFRRFANLYGYTRILRASAEEWKVEPKWLVDLRTKLNNSMKVRSANFGYKL
jgi:Ser/Thr protein kinase RdoA (MazF antagonist)